LKKIFIILIFILQALFLTSPALLRADADQVQKNADLFRDIGIEEKLGEFIPLDLVFTNESGEEVTLQKYFEKGKPVLLNLIYFNCPSLCSLILNGVADGINDLTWTPGNQFTVLTVSIDHNEDHIIASQQKQAYLEMLNKDGIEDGWHFLTGSEENIRALSNAVGFNFKWSDEAQEYLHGSGIMFISPEGRISRYLYGVMYSELNIRNALFDAADGRVGSTVERIMLYCFTYDAESGSYTPYAVRIMKLGGVAMLLVLGLFLGIFWIRERKKSNSDIRLDD